MFSNTIFAFYGFILFVGVSHGFRPTVQTDCGPVQGIPPTLVPTVIGPYSFRGIPYARPPVNDLRWRPPEPIAAENKNCWTGTLDASKFGNFCYQRRRNDTSQYFGSEDCLYLNVWTPTIDPTAKLPVAVWIHGGYLETGNGNEDNFSPTGKLSSETNIVYVSFNYRLQAFGFMALQWLADDSPKNTSGNYGFMDQIEVLKWVQRNIVKFGGDKDKVTLYGQSSGGTSIYALLASPLAKGLFHQAWLSSPSPILNMSAADAFEDNMVFVNNTGCLNVTCLYGLSPEEVTRSIPWDVYPYWAMSDQLDLPEKGYFDGALPVIDGYVLLEPPFDAWVNGHGNDVPVLIGTTAQETNIGPQERDLASWNKTTYESKIREKLSAFGDVITEMALRLYPVDSKTPEYQYTSMTSDLRMHCGNDYASLILAKSFTSPVYRYVITYTPSIPVAYTLYDTFVASYSAHTLDLFGFYGTMNSLVGKSSPADKAFELTMRREMESFIKTGRPLRYWWKPFPEATATLYEDVYVSDGYHTWECQFWLANGFFSYSWIN